MTASGALSAIVKLRVGFCRRLGAHRRDCGAGQQCPGDCGFLRHCALLLSLGRKKGMLPGTETSNGGGCFVASCPTGLRPGRATTASEASGETIPCFLLVRTAPHAVCPGLHAGSYPLQNAVGGPLLEVGGSAKRRRFFPDAFDTGRRRSSRNPLPPGTARGPTPRRTRWTATGRRSPRATATSPPPVPCGRATVECRIIAIDRLPQARHVPLERHSAHRGLESRPDAGPPVGRDGGDVLDADLPGCRRRRGARPWSTRIAPSRRAPGDSATARRRERNSGR